MTEQIAGFDVEHLHGPEKISYAEDELVVVCLVRDGSPWVKPFVEHYSSLGVKHLFFLDNGSTDDTVEALTSYENVTVLRTGAPFREYQHPMRRYLIERFCRGRWSLCVDIDEFFDYPYSDIVRLDALLGYLNRNSYTAVVAQMLDMFPQEVSTGREGNPEAFSRESHGFYDISNLEVQSIQEHPSCPPDNTYASDEIEFFKAGIRGTVFGVNTALTKHPLVFSDGKVRPVDPGVHWVGNARVADLTCVLYHYKFLGDYLRELAARTVRGQQHRRNPGAYEKYLAVLEENPNLQLKRETSKQISRVDDLLEAGFLVASGSYLDWVGAEEERDLVRTLSPDEPRTLVESYLECRNQERTKTLEVGRLQQRSFRRKKKAGDRGRKAQDPAKQSPGRGKKPQGAKGGQRAAWQPSVLKRLFERPGIHPRTVVDVGVGRGTPRLYAAFPEAFQVLIEPLKEHEAALQNILEQYEGEYFLTAVGSSRRKADINVEPKRKYKSSLQERTALTSTGQPVEKREIPVTTLDLLVEEQKLQPPFGLKIDTEGFELEVIHGAAKFLRETQFVIAEVSLVERFVGGYSFSEFTEAMTKNGFFLWDILNTHERYVDAVFLPSLNHQPTSLLLRHARSRARNIVRSFAKRRN